MKRFKAGNVRVVRAHGVAAAVQEVEGMKRVAGALRCSGLVQVDEGQRTFGMHQLLQQHRQRLQQVDISQPWVRQTEKEHRISVAFRMLLANEAAQGEKA